MKQTPRPRFEPATGQSRIALGALLLAALLPLVLASCATSAADPDAGSLAAATAAQPLGEVAADPQHRAAMLAEQWGIEVVSIRLTAHDHMIDYRYRVLDPEKATSLFKRQIKPRLIHQRTGQALAVPETAKVGPLRNSNTPQQGKIYWMFFGNGGHLVQHGDRVAVVIGDYRIDDLVVE